MSTDVQAPVDTPVVESKTDAKPPVVDAFANDPVAPEKTLSQQEAAPAEMNNDKPAEEPKVEAFANDPVSADATPAAAAAAAEPVTHGNLGYKAPGLLSHLRFSSRYFWLGDEAVPASDLKQYLQSDKSEGAQQTAAWSSQTGKGLLYFVKREEDKKTPSGVINLSEITELTKGANNDFSFKLHGKEHAFQSTTPELRDGWYTSVESASQHAVGLKEDMVSSGGYKETLSNLAAPAGLAVGAAGAAGAAGAVTAAASSSNSENADKTATSKSKDRSASRNKRSSIFGGILAKKDEPQEKTVEEKNEEAAEAKEESKQEAEKAEEKDEAAVAAEKKEEAKKEELKKEKAAKEQAEKDKKAQEKKAAAAKKEQEKKEKAAKEQAEKEKKAADKKAAEAKKEQERKEKEAQKNLAKAQKEKKDAEEKEAAAKAAETKAEEKKVEEAEAEEKKKDLEIAGAGAGAAAVAGAGVAAATGSKDDSTPTNAEPLADKTNVDSPTPTETTKTSKSTKRNSIFGFFQKASTPTTEKKEDEVVPAEASKEDETAKEETTVTDLPEAGKNGSIKGKSIHENGAAVNGTAVNGHAVNGTAAVEKPTADTTAPASTETPTTEKRRSIFGFGSMKKEKEAKTEATSNDEAVAPTAAATATPATAAAATAAVTTNGTSDTEASATKTKQPSKLSEFIRRPSQLMKSKQAAQKDKTNSTAPATVAEAEGKDDGVKVNGATGIDKKTEDVLETAKVEPVKPETETTPAEVSEEKKGATVIGDVVPEAVSVGKAEDSAAQHGIAPVVSVTA